MFSIGDKVIVFNDCRNSGVVEISNPGTIKMSYGFPRIYYVRFDDGNATWVFEKDITHYDEQESLECDDVNCLFNNE